MRSKFVPKEFYEDSLSEDKKPSNLVTLHFRNDPSTRHWLVPPVYLVYNVMCAGFCDIRPRYGLLGFFHAPRRSVPQR